MENNIMFTSGYGGNGAKCEIEIDKEWYVIDIDHVKEIIQKAIISKGYTITKTNRQKYPRLFIKD